MDDPLKSGLERKAIRARSCDDTPYDDLVRVRLASHLDRGFLDKFLCNGAASFDAPSSSFLLPLFAFLRISAFQENPRPSDFLIEIFRHGHEEDSPLSHSLDRQEKILDDGVHKRLTLQMFGPQSSERERKMDLLIGRPLSSACPTIYVTRLAVLWSSRRMRRGRGGRLDVLNPLSSADSKLDLPFSTSSCSPHAARTI